MRKSCSRRSIEQLQLLLNFSNEISLLNYQDEFLRETGSFINCRFGQLFDRKDLFKKCGRIGISRTKLNDTIDLLSTYPRQFN